MNKLGLKSKKPVFCYPILESTRNGYINKVTELSKKQNTMLELRIDYLLCLGLSIEQIIDFISVLKKKYTSKKLIATIRTIDQGGKVDLTKEKYFYFVKLLYLKSRVHAIDIEYKFYKVDKQYYDSLFKKKKKDVIMSMHIFDKVFFVKDYKDIFKEMAESKSNIVKFAIKVYTKDDLFNFMDTARKSYGLFKREHKKVVFIAMGELGKVSRVFPEYTHTSIVFLNAYQAEDKALGQMSATIYNKYRKLLDKKRKN